MDHPRLGRLEHTGFAWEGVAALPRFAAPGAALRRPDDAPPGMVKVRVEDRGGAGISAQQEAAVAALFDREAEVFAAVWAELAAPLKNFDPHTELICPEVVVSSYHADGVAYLGFTIDADGHLEHGFQVVYHPTRGTSWGDAEAIDAVAGADNGPPPDDD